MALKAIDPVCGMTVEVNESTLHTTFEGKDYYFCAPACLKNFEKDPTKFLNNSNEHHHTH